MWTWKQRWFQDISELSKAACTLRNTGSSIKNHVLFGICWLGCSTEGKAAHTHGCSCSSCLGDNFTGAGRPSGCWRCGPGWPKFSSTASCHKPFIETLAAPPWFSIPGHPFPVTRALSQISLQFAKKSLVELQEFEATNVIWVKAQWEANLDSALWPKQQILLWSKHWAQNDLNTAKLPHSSKPVK